MSFQGTFVSFSDVSRIRSASGPGGPHPPIWVGGASDAAVRPDMFATMAEKVLDLSKETVR